MSIDGGGVIRTGQGDLNFEWDGKSASGANVPDGEHRLKLESGGQIVIVPVVIDRMPPVISNITLQQGAFDYESLSYQVSGTANIEDVGLAGVDPTSVHVDIKGQGISNITSSYDEGSETVSYQATVTIPPDIVYQPSTSAYRVLQSQQNPVVAVEVTAADSLSNDGEPQQEEFPQQQPFAELPPELEAVINDLFPLYAGANEDLIAGAIGRAFGPVLGKEGGKTLAKASGKELSRKEAAELLDDLVSSMPKAQTQLPWDRIKATQGAWEKTILPKSFEIELKGGQKVWVSQNATEHIRDELVGLVKANSGNSIHPQIFRIINQQKLQEALTILDKASIGPVNYGKKIVIDGWEVVIEQTGKSGPLPVVTHLMRVY